MSREARAGAVLERVEQAGEVGTERRLAQHDRDALTRAVQHLAGGDGLVVGGEAARREGGDLVRGGAGGVALHALAAREGQVEPPEQVAAAGPARRASA